MKLRPDYADGYINIGLTYIEWEKYSSGARQPRKGAGAQPEQRPCSLLPCAGGTTRGESGCRNCRSANGGSTVSTISRCAARAWTSPITSSINTTKPIKQFEALQAIDPDDLAAHYNLAILYRRMGHERKSRRTGRLVRDQAGRSRSAHLLARFSSQTSRRSRPKAFPGTCIRIQWSRMPRVTGSVESYDRQGTGGSFLRSLSRTALVLPFEGVLAMAAPFARQQVKLPGPIERTYDAKAETCSKGSEISHRRHSARRQFRRCRQRMRLER